MDNENVPHTTEGGKEYDLMLQLERLESLLEEMDATAMEAAPSTEQRLGELGISGRKELVETIQRIHRELDRLDAGHGN